MEDVQDVIARWVKYTELKRENLLLTRNVCILRRDAAILF